MTKDDLKEAERFEKWLKGEKLDELKKEAEEYTNNIDYTTTVKMIDCVPYHENCDVADMIAEAYLAGAEPREKRIAELERKLKVETELNNRLGLAYREYEQLTKEQDEHLAKLEKENAELEKQLDIVRNERNLFQERSEDILENYYCDHKCKCTELEKENAELKEELKKWKDEWQEQVQKATDEGYARTLQTIQLSKAIEIIKTLADDLSMYSGNYQKELLEAKQFLKESE